MPVAGLDIRLGAGFLDTEYNDSNFDGDGSDLPNSPEQTFNGLVRYEFPIGETLLASAMLDFNYVDDINKCAEGYRVCQADSYTLYNGRVSLGSQSGRWNVALWGQNLDDEEYQTEVFQQLSLGNYITSWGAPRTWGVTLRVNL
jgi:iron complex outermembrane receptor protein